ncbi:MAG TPA: hypothetical protein VNQ79_13050 [Blastocatellia bacterium]|nr:hypothetical protein [Blastocatellia bacterium]
MDVLSFRFPFSVLEEYFALAEKYGIDPELQTARDEDAEAVECGV